MTQPSRAVVIAVLVALFILIFIAIPRIEVDVFEVGASKDGYSVGYQIGPHYLGTSTWEGIPYALTKDTFGSDPRPPSLIYTPPETRDLRGSHPNWWRPDGGTYGLPAAADRPADATLHTYHACDSIPPLCDSSWTQKWRYYGGPKGWRMSPYY